MDPLFRLRNGDWIDLNHVVGVRMTRECGRYWIYVAHDRTQALAETMLSFRNRKEAENYRDTLAAVVNQRRKAILSLWDIMREQ